MDRSRILIVDDETDVLEPTRWLLQEGGYEVYTAASGEAAFRYFLAIHPHLLVVDYKLPGISGIDFVKAAKQQDPKVKAIIITGFLPQIEGVRAMAEREGTPVLRKPVKTEDLQQAVQQALG